MGQSTNAIVAYCIPLKDFSVGFESEYSHINLSDFEDDMEIFNKKFSKKYGCVLEVHCSDTAEMYVLAIDGTITTAWRGSPQRLHNLSVDPTWDAKLAEGLKYLRKLAKKQEHAESFETCGEPGWYTFSWWC